MKYLLRKIAFMIPALFAVTLIGFMFSVNTPGDPVEIMTGSTSSQGSMQTNTASRDIKDSLRKELGLDKPLFYFSLGTASDPAEINAFSSLNEQHTVRYLSRKYGKPELVVKLFRQLDKAAEDLVQFNPELWIQTQLSQIDSSGLPDSTIQKMKSAFSVSEITAVTDLLKNIFHNLKNVYDETVFVSLLDSGRVLAASHPALVSVQKELEKIAHQYRHVVSDKSNMSTWIPSFRWNGTGNRYHLWLNNFLRGNFGISYADGQPVGNKIWTKFTRSFILILFSVVLAYFISIPAGVYSAKYKDRWPDKMYGWFSFVLFSLPSYFVGTMLLYLFANHEILAWFPESGFCNPDTYNPEAPFFTRLAEQWPFMVLPVITYTYSSFAFISRVVRSSMLENLGADYVRTARAKGLPENKVLWKHAMRNSMIPVITMFVNVFPAAVGGSVIVESVFTYPGMGLESITAIQHADHPVLIGIIVLAGIMTTFAYFLADLLYLWADPRIKMKTTR